MTTTEALLGRFRLAAAAAVLILFSACVVGPDYKLPDVPVPVEYQYAAPAGAEAQAMNLSRWWETFSDQMLLRLIEDAVKSNHDIKLAQARVREARASLAVSFAGFLPFGSLNASMSRSEASANARGSTPFISTDQGTDGTDGDNRFSTPPSNLYQTGFDATWELDIFGAVQRQVEAAEDLLQAQIDERRDTLVTLISEVARNYIVLRGTQNELEITRKNADAQAETVKLQRERQQAGLTSELTVAQAEALLRTTQAQLPALEVPIRQSINNLGVLLGREPGALKEELLVEAALPHGPPVVPAGLPSDLLRRRSDIRRAERQLAAATANIGVAVADFFPKFQLTGAAGFRSANSSNLFSRGSGYWSYGPEITWNIINWPAIVANIELQNARQEEALIAYKQTILLALQDVENALVAYDREQARFNSLSESVEANRRALSLAQQLNSAGLVDFLNVLNAEQAVFQSEDQLAQSARAVSEDLVALYKALGGGWETLDPQLEPRK